jgi:hypothetical protein
VEDCVGEDCRVKHFTVSDVRAVDWEFVDEDDKKKKTGKVKHGSAEKETATDKDMQTVLEAAIAAYYKPNPKLGKCSGTCVCRDTGDVLSTTTTAGMEFQIPYPSLGKTGKVSGTYTLEVRVTKGQCGPPKKVVIGPLAWLGGTLRDTAVALAELGARHKPGRG